MNARCWLLLCLALGCWPSVKAEAHFLFIRIGPPAEAGRAAEVYFSELAEAGDPRFIDKIAHTQLWLQQTPDKFEPLKVHKGADRLRVQLPVSGSLIVVGSCPYGVLARPMKTPFLLRHFPKAMAGNPEELNRMKPYGKLPLEIVATLDGERIHFVALRDGKPLPSALFTTVDAKLANEKITANAEGRATWKPPSPGRYSVYTSFVSQVAGQVDGKKYEEIRDFATLAFSWPLERKEPDAEAVALFQEAIATRAQWRDFLGFTARVEGQMDGRSFTGTVTVNAKGDVEMNTEEEVVQPWVQEQLESIAMHRNAGPSKPATERPKPALRFADTRDDHPLGRLLIFDGGKFAASYRVKNKQIMVVNRYTARQHMTITVLDNERNRDGHFLPHSYTVQYWDSATGNLKQTETVQERWQRFGNWDLPTRHTVTIATETGLAVRSFTLSKHELLKAKD